MRFMLVCKALKWTAAGASSLYMLHSWRKQQNLATVSADWKPPSLSKLSEYFNGVAKPSTEQLRLVNVHVFFRHGIRTPLFCELPGMDEVEYDKNVLIDSTNRKCKFNHIITDLKGGPQPQKELQKKYDGIVFEGGLSAGVMVDLGREQMYKLGRRLRKKYIDGWTLGPSFNLNEIYMRSSNVDRCLDSLECTVAGLYGVDDLDRKVDPIFFRTAPDSQEILYPNPFRCKTLEAALLNSETYLNTQCDFTNVLDTLSRHQGICVQTSNRLDVMLEWRDHLSARTAMGLSVPCFLNTLRDDIEKAAVLALKIQTCGTPDDRKMVLMLNTGPIFSLFSENVTEAIKRRDLTTVKKMHLFACHDSTIVPLMEALGCFDEAWPPFAADLCLELYEGAKDRFYVKVVYCDKDMKLADQPSTVVTLEKFNEIIKPYLMTESEQRLFCSDEAQARDRFIDKTVDECTGGRRKKGCPDVCKKPRHLETSSCTPNSTR